MTDEYLTTREVEQLVRLNRVTIYRLIEDGEIPAIKIGGQWRFPRTAMEQWLAGKAVLAARAPLAEEQPSLADLLATLDLQPVVAALEAATGLAMCIATPDGQPLVTCGVCHPFCSVVRTTPQGQQACAASWAALGQGECSSLICHAGLRYLAIPVEAQDRRMALVVAGPFVADEAGREQVRQFLPQTAQRNAIDPHALLKHLPTVRQMSPPETEALARLLESVVSAVTQAAYGQHQANARLRQIERLASR